MDYYDFFIDLLKQLVAIPSQSQKEEACAIFLTQFLREQLGMDAHMTRIEGESCNVTASWGKAGNGKKILLGGHLDTVSPAEGWKSDPYTLTVDGDRGYGLGAADMKGGLAAQITVLKRLYDEGAAVKAAPNCDIVFAALCDEERHSIGANAFVKELGADRADFAVLAEPHYDDMIVGAAGKVFLKLTVKGSAGHAANPETGVSAISCMARFLAAVDETYGALYRQGSCASHCVLRLESKYEGYSLNIPEECAAWLNKQLYVSEKAEDFISDLKRIYQETAGEGRLTISREIPCYPSYEIDRGHPLLQELLSLLSGKYGHRPQLRVNQSVSDGNILWAQGGIPTVLFGPQGCDYHKPNESIVLSSARRYMDMLYDFLSLS